MSAGSAYRWDYVGEDALIGLESSNTTEPAHRERAARFGVDSNLERRAIFARVARVDRAPNLS